MDKKGLKFAPVGGISEAKFYLYCSSKISKAGHEFDDRIEHLPVQINSSGLWLLGSRQ